MSIPFIIHVELLSWALRWAASFVELQPVRAGALAHLGSGSLPAVRGGRCLLSALTALPSKHVLSLCLLQRAPHIATGLPREAGVKTKTQLNSERNVLRQLLASILGASASEDLKEAAQPFARHVSRHFAMLVAAGASAPNKQRGQVSKTGFCINLRRVSWVQRQAIGLGEHACMLPFVLCLCFLLLGGMTWPVLPRPSICNDAWPPPLATGCMCPSGEWAALLERCCARLASMATMTLYQHDMLTRTSTRQPAGAQPGLLCVQDPQGNEGLGPQPALPVAEAGSSAPASVTASPSGLAGGSVEAASQERAGQSSSRAPFKTQSLMELECHLFLDAIVMVRADSAGLLSKRHRCLDCHLCIAIIVVHARE